LQQLDRVTTAFTAASSEPNRDGHKDRLHSPVRQSQCRSKNTEKTAKQKQKTSKTKTTSQTHKTVAGKKKHKSQASG
jgi:hypothetical protein